MFKRGKGGDVSAGKDSGARQTFPAARKDTKELNEPSETDTAKSAARASTPQRAVPAYETRKPTVRTLSTTQPQTAVPDAAPANLHVGRGLKLEGKIQSCDSLVIEGNVQATIDSKSLTITDTGDVTGEATVGSAEINGKFDGTLNVSGCLTIKSTGRITGTVHYGELKVEQGGKVTGQIESREESGRPAASKPREAIATALPDAASA